MIAYKVLRRKQDKLFSWNMFCPRKFLLEYVEGQVTTPVAGSKIFVFADRDKALNYDFYDENVETWEVEVPDMEPVEFIPYYNAGAKIWEAFWNCGINRAAMVPPSTHITSSVKLLRKLDRP